MSVRCTHLCLTAVALLVVVAATVMLVAACGAGGTSGASHVQASRLSDRSYFAPAGLSPQHLAFNGVASVDLAGPWRGGD
jgi:hypothetical protein